MKVTVPSFAKINIGLRIGARRLDGFHELRTVYQTIALSDLIHVSVVRGTGVEIRCDDPRVPCDSTNTCYKIAERALERLKAQGRIVIEIEKRLPVQGGLGGASGNAVAALLALERVLKKRLDPAERLRIAAAIGSDLPLFLIGGTILGVGRGEEVSPVPDLPATPCVIALPDVAVSTPKAFRDWDESCGAGIPAGENNIREREALSPETSITKLTHPTHSDRMVEFSREISAWLTAAEGGRRSGVSAKGGGRAENPLLDLVRTGIENDFERVVFPQYPELREVKRVLLSSGARYASLSGSGSGVYGLFDSREKAARAAGKLRKQGTRSVVTTTSTRRQYWKKLRAVSD